MECREQFKMLCISSGHHACERDKQFFLVVYNKEYFKLIIKCYTNIYMFVDGGREGGGVGVVVMKYGD